MSDQHDTLLLDDSLQDQFEELLQRASKDALSGLLNRATLEQYIRSRIDGMVAGESCAFFIVDIDNFKNVNDTLGHRTGDQAIRSCATALSHIFRASDIVGRLGGDEFAIFICGEDVTVGLVRNRAEEICEKLQLSLGDRKPINLTVSVGIYMANGAQDFNGLYQSADLALYKAKKAGKNRYCLKASDSYQSDGDEDAQTVGAISVGNLLENLDSGVALLELAKPLRLIYVSPSFCRMLGVQLQNLAVPMELQSIVHPDDSVQLEDELFKAVGTAAGAHLPVRIMSADGRGWLWWQLSAVSVPYNSPQPVMLLTATDVSAYKSGEERLEDLNETLLAALAQTEQQIWQVDLPRRTFSALNSSGQQVKGMEMRFPEDLIERGWIHHNSRERFREFARELLGGQSQGYGNFIFRLESGSYGWIALSYRMIYDADGHAVKAVGVREDLASTFKGQSPGNVPQRLLPQALLSDLIMRIRLNLSQDRVEDLWMEGKDLTDGMAENSALALLRDKKARVFNEDDRKALSDFFDPDKLLELYEKDKCWLSFEYQRADSGGNIRRVRNVLHLMKSHSSNDIYLNAYLLRLNVPTEWEKALPKQNNRDQVTRLYVRETIEELGRKLITTDSAGTALAVLQTSGIDITDDRLRKAIACALMVGIGGGCILGQLDEDKMLILIHGAHSREGLRKRLEEATSFIRLVVNDLPSSSRFIFGAAMQGKDGNDYEGLLSCALNLCSVWWNASADMVAFHNKDDDWSWRQLQSETADEKINLFAAEMDRPLSEGEKDVAFDCISAMLAADSLDSSVNGVLKIIGDYYQADRVYTMILSDDRNVVSMPNEWNSSEKLSLQQVVSGMRFERFPILKHCLESRQPIFLKRNHPTGVGRESEGESWHFSCFPLKRDAKIEGFLCIENARVHTGNAALFSTIIPFIMKEKERFHNIRQSGGESDSLMSLPDLRAFMGTVYTLTGQNYSSMGVVCIDIPSMATINGKEGFEYGSNLLSYISKNLTDIFSSKLVFRTWEAEFVAFCPNTTRQVFLGRCGRLRSILQRRYAQAIRIGRSWSDGDFSGHLLVEEARQNMAMESATQTSYPWMDAMQGQEVPDAVLQSIDVASLVLYYQPKVDMRDGRLIGAEALVRGVDGQGGIIPPDKFIRILEERGGIRELDLFVLDQALRQVTAWKNAGYGVVNVAVNLSRVTLRGSTILASVLATQSRYPNVPMDALEFEITENADVIENEEFRQIVDRFRSCGLHVGLDDFGSRYANISLFTDVVFDTVKLDRSLISGIVDNPINRMMVRDLVQICNARSMDCVAEGVETEKQIDALLEAGCHLAQGYHYDKPLPAIDFERKYLAAAGANA